jgi:hypothetical protein
MRRQRTLLLQYSRGQFESKHVRFLSEKMNNHGRFYEVQKSASQRGGLLGTWKCFSPTAEEEERSY